MGKWVYSPERIDKQPKRGDFRPICGVLDTSDYIAFYLNIGNGFILYEYTEKTKTKPVLAFDVQEEAENLKDKVHKKAPAFNPGYSGYPRTAPGAALVMGGCLFAAFAMLSLMPREWIGAR